MKTLPEILDGLRGKDDKQRAEALDASREFGAAGIEPIAPLLGDPETEIRRAGKRALESIVHDAGHGGTLGTKAEETEAKLILALEQAEADQPRRELIWFLSEVGSQPSVKVLAPLLTVMVPVYV